MNKTWTSSLGSLLTLVAPAAAQIVTMAPPRDGVSGTGTVTVERAAESMCMQVQLLASGKTMKEALVALRLRGDHARQQLLGLGAEPASVVVEPSQVQGESDERRQMIERMLREHAEQEADADKAAKAAKVQKPVRVQAQLVAEWKLAKKPHDELLDFTHKLQQDLIALDLGGAKEAQKLSPEEQKAVEEAELQISSFPAGSAEPGQPSFFFVAAIPAEELDQARAQCFREATRRAERLAKAAARELGELTGVSATEPYDQDNPWMQWLPQHAWDEDAIGRYLLRQRARSETFAAGLTLGKVEHRLSLTANYAFKPR